MITNVQPINQSIRENDILEVSIPGNHKYFEPRLFYKGNSRNNRVYRDLLC